MISSGLKLFEFILHIKPMLYVCYMFVICLLYVCYTFAFPPFYLEMSLLLYSIQITLIKWREPEQRRKSDLPSFKVTSWQRVRSDSKGEGKDTQKFDFMSS